MVSELTTKALLKTLYRLLMWTCYKLWRYTPLNKWETNSLSLFIKLLSSCCLFSFHLLKYIHLYHNQLNLNNTNFVFKVSENNAEPTMIHTPSNNFVLTLAYIFNRFSPYFFIYDSSEKFISAFSREDTELAIIWATSFFVHQETSKRKIITVMESC